MPTRHFLASVLIAATMPAVALFAAGPAEAGRPKFETLYAFTASKGDGAIPEDPPTPAGGSLLYGTTVLGGNGFGAVYSFDTATGVETPVYGFAGGTDGAQPQAGVTYLAGFLYGTTYEGGTGRGKLCQGQGCGTVYRIDTATGKETVLHSFMGGTDGRIPSGGKLVLLKGALYGSTEYGGSGNVGTVYRVDPAKGTVSTVYSFKGGMDGRRPQGGLRVAGGVLVGTTFEGGGRGCKYACGTLFSVDPATGVETVLHAFTGSADGQYPFGDLTGHGSVVYGSTLTGGAAGHGAVYEFDMAANAETVLHSFVASDDGAAPTGVTYDNGRLYGGTLVGGSYGLGVVYRIDTATLAETVLHEFTGDVDGGLAYGGPSMQGGALYGTTYQGGDLTACPAMGCGTLFRIMQ